jgi:hypothetical protein
MTPEKRALIRAFVENEKMFEAVKSVLLSGMIGDDFTSRNWVFGIDKKQSDSAYGKEVKITAKALEWINHGFTELSQLARTNPQPSTLNEAR